jgi:hypothetical protein
MAIDSVHPLYQEFVDDWRTMRDTYRGERVIKHLGTRYLPPTSGHRLDGMAVGQKGYESYKAYKERAIFPDFVSSAIEAMIGLLHNRPPRIELPRQMEGLRENATVKGESLYALLRRINEAQLVTGRIGLLLDVPDGSMVGTLPYIATYEAEAMLNWDDGRREEIVEQTLNFVSLNESEYERQPDFEWEFEEKYRVLTLGDPYDNQTMGLYRVGLFRDTTDFREDALIVPSIAGRVMNKIPFVMINSKDIIPEPDDPPLMGLARLSLAVYRGEADYRQALYMQGQDTLVLVGSIDESDQVRAGAGTVIRLPEGGDAKYVGTNSQGLPEMRLALENARKEAADLGGKLLDTERRSAEAAEALRIRVAARTATLNAIAISGAKGLETLLKMAAEWLGANPEEVLVEPNLDFTNQTLDGRTLFDLMGAKNMGAPLSTKSIHTLLRERGMTEMDFEREMAEIESEEPIVPGTGDQPDLNMEQQNGTDI